MNIVLLQYELNGAQEVLIERRRRVMKIESPTFDDSQSRVAWGCRVVFSFIKEVGRHTMRCAVTLLERVKSARTTKCELRCTQKPLDEKQGRDGVGVEKVKGVVERKAQK